MRMMNDDTYIIIVGKFIHFQMTKTWKTLNEYAYFK